MRALDDDRERRARRGVLLGLHLPAPGRRHRDRYTGRRGLRAHAPVWLTPGDVIEVFVEGVGTISNTVVAEKDTPADWPWRPLEVDTANF